MTYEESSALTTDITFRGRVKVACLKFASIILNEGGAVPAHNTRVKWAIQCHQQPDVTAGQVQHSVVLEPAVESAGADVTDAVLQTTVQTVVERLM